MSDEKKKALEAEIRSYVGKPIGPMVTARDRLAEYGDRVTIAFNVTM